MKCNCCGSQDIYDGRCYDCGAEDIEFPTLEAFHQSFFGRTPEFWSDLIDKKGYTVLKNPSYRALGDNRYKQSFAISGEINND